MKIVMVLLLLLFLHKSISLPQNTSSEYAKSKNEFHKLLINKSESPNSSLKSSERQYITSVNGVTVVHVLGYPPELIEITNQTHSTKEFLFAVTTPLSLKPHKPFSLVVTLLEDTKYPIKFNLSILHYKNLLLPSKQATLSSNKSEVIIFNTKDIPEEFISVFTSGLQLVVLAESTGQETTSHSIQSKTIFIPSRPVSQKEIIIETNKKRYFPGEKILYRITIIDFLTRRPAPTPESLKIRFLNRKYKAVWDEPVLTNTSSLGVYTGSAIARKDIAFLHVSLTNEQNVDKYHQVSVKRIKKTSEYFKIKLASEMNSIHLRDSKLNLNISFLTADTEGLPVDGACQVQLTAESNNVHPHPHWRYNPIVFYTTNFTTSNEVKTTKMTLDIVEILRRTGIDYFDTDLIIRTKAKCSHAPSGLHVEAYRSTDFHNKETFHGNIVSAKIFPDDNNNFAMIYIKMKMMRRTRNPLKEGDYSKPLNVTFDISKEFFPHLEFNVKKTINFERIPSDGILNINFSISNFTAVRRYLSQSFVLVEIDGSEFKLANHKIPWGVIPELRISHVDKRALYRSGDIARFYVCTTETILRELKLNTALFSSEGVISTNQSTLSLSGQNLELLEIKIPKEFQSIPTTLHLSAFAKCPFGFADLNSPYKDIISDCVMETSISFDINVPKPILSLVSISSHNNANRIYLSITGRRGAINYASVELYELDENEQESESILTCDDLKPDKLTNYLRRNDEGVRAFSNALKQQKLTIPSLRSEPVSTHFFELKPSQMKNGSMELTLSLDPKLYNGKYKIRATTLSDTYAGAISTNEIVIDVPPPNITFHIPIVPKSMIVGETIELTTWVKNPSNNIFNGTVTYEYFHNKLVGSNFTQSLVMLPNSYRSLKFPITAQETGQLVIKMRASDGIETTKTVKVVPEGRLKKFTNSILLRDNNESHQGALDNVPINYPPGCEPYSGSNITTQFYGKDIFGDLHSALKSGMLNKMKVRSYESTVNYWTIMSIAGAAQDNYTGPNHNSQEKPFKRELLKKLTYKPLKNIEKEVLLVALLEGQLVTANAYKQDVNASQLVTTLLGLQNEDGSFIGQYPDCKKSNSTANSILDVTFVETIFGLLGLHVSRQFLTEQSSIDEAMDLGLQFLESAPNIIHGEPNKLDDTYVLSLLGYLYSTIKHKDADKVFKRLKARAVSNSDGTYWNSKWDDDYSCSKSKRNFTITTTAFALMTYVKMEQPDTFDIAKWLVGQRNANGMYTSLADTAIAMRALEMFKNHAPSSYSLAQRSFQCSTLWENSTTGIYFSFKKTIDESSGILQLNICLFHESAQKLFVRLPPAYVFVESDVEEESSRKDNNIFGSRYFGVKYSYKSGKLRFDITRKNLLKKKCYDLKAYDLCKETDKFVSMKYKTPGRIEVQNSKNKKEYTVKYFFL